MFPNSFNCFQFIKFNPSLGGVGEGGGNFTPTVDFLLINNSQTVKAAALAFCSI